MLTKTQIQQLEIIQEAAAESWDETSYNLRLGREYVEVGSDAPHIRQCSSFGIQIPPFGCVLVSTEEWLRVPKQVYGRWGLRIRPALSGLIFQAGPQIEPGYKGRLFGLLFNLSSTEYRLEQNKELWSIDFTTFGETEATKLLPEANEVLDLTINSYVTAQFPQGGPGETLAALGKEFASLELFRSEIKLEVASLRAELREEEQRLRTERETTRNDQLAATYQRLENAHQKLADQRSARTTYVGTFLFGGFLVALCAFVPMIISKTNYDKDAFSALVEGRYNFKDMDARLRDRDASMLAQVKALQTELEALRDQLRGVNQQVATPMTTPTLSPTPTPSPPPRK